jgi:hypothetical protein
VASLYTSPKKFVKIRKGMMKEEQSIKTENTSPILLQCVEFEGSITFNTHALEVHRSHKVAVAVGTQESAQMPNALETTRSKKSRIQSTMLVIHSKF